MVNLPLTTRQFNRLVSAVNDDDDDDEIDYFSVCWKTKQETHQEMRYPNVTSLYFATPLAFNAPDDEFPWDNLHKILHGGQRDNGEEILPKVSTL